MKWFCKIEEIPAESDAAWRQHLDYNVVRCRRTVYDRSTLLGFDFLNSERGLTESVEPTKTLRAVIQLTWVSHI